MLCDQGNNHHKVFFFFFKMRKTIFFSLLLAELTYCENNEGLCENGGTCISLPEEDGNYKCLCSQNFYGVNCEQEKKVSSVIIIIIIFIILFSRVNFIYK